MADRVRLVQRVLRRLRKTRTTGLPGQVPSEDVAELSARAGRLRGLGDPFSEVRLSRYVTCEGVTGVRTRSGGMCVAKDV